LGGDEEGSASLGCWRYVIKSMLILLDHGGIIVLVDDEKAADSIVYSWNFGVSWASFKFSTKPIRVGHLAIEPTSTSLKFILEGVYPRGSVSSDVKSLIVSFDFSELFKRKCDANDFQKWGMHDEGTEGRCFLGRRVSFKRRKSDALCVVGQEFVEQDPDVAVCECTNLDFEWYDVHLMWQ
jgi:hypothetical protein